MKYRPEIDGLRAVAVLPVILFHAGFEAFGGGYVGVDVFFVISGYLITTIISKAILDRNFSIIEFYERRARRILPALFLVVFATIPFSLLWMLPNQREDFFQSIVAVNIFSSNVLFWLEDGYFDFGSEDKPLLHTWSLAVEEQFYVAFPLLLLLLMRRGRKPMTSLALLALLSFAACIWAVRVMPSAAFYLVPFRAWELLAGALCALVLINRSIIRSESAAALGLTMILVSFFWLTPDTLFPSEYTLLPVVGTSLVILATDQRTFVGRLLTIRPLIGIGLISYSAYLWHQPLLAMARIRLNSELSAPLAALLISLTFALAWLTWAFLEQPARQATRSCVKPIQALFNSQAKVFFTSGAAVIILVAFGSWGTSRDGFASSFDSINTAGYRWDNRALQSESWSVLRKESATRQGGATGNPNEHTDWFNDPDRKDLLVIGNSHAKDLYNAFIQNSDLTKLFEVARYGIQLRELIGENHFWQAPNYLEADYVFVATAYTGEDIDALPEIVERMLMEGKRTVIISNSPNFSGSAVVTPADEIVIQELMHNTGRPFEEIAEEVNHVYWQRLSGPAQAAVEEKNTALERIAMTMNVPYLDRLDYICEEEEKKCAALADDLTKHFYDKHHTTLAGARYFAIRMEEIGWLKPVFSGIKDH